MELISQAILAIIVAAATIVLLFAVKGRMLTPIRKGNGVEVFTLVKVSGNAESLEHTLRGLRWLMDDGKIDMPIIIVTKELDDDTADRVNRLAQECGGVVCRPDGLHKIIGE